MRKLLLLVFLMACTDPAGPPEPECTDHSRWLHTEDCRGCVDSVFVEITICYERHTYQLP